MPRKITPEKEEEVVQMYVSGNSATAVAKHFGVHLATIRMALLRAGVSRRPLGRPVSEEARKKMCQMYLSGSSQRAIGKMFKMSAPVVSRILELSGIRARTGQYGEAHGNWKGGRYVLDGYEYVRVREDHPFAAMRKKNMYVAAHRLVVAEKLGRPLLAHETVHHIDGDTLNNDPSNLQLKSTRHGKGVVHRCCNCGSYNVKTVEVE